MTGLLLVEFVSDYELIICEKCGKKRRRSSAIWTSIFGWWSAKGFISMPFILIDKIKASIQEDKQSEQIIESFIKENIGTKKIGGDSQSGIQKLLKRFNQIEEEHEFEELDETFENK